MHQRLLRGDTFSVLRYSLCYTQNKPCSLSKQDLPLYHGFRHLLSFIQPSFPSPLPSLLPSLGEGTGVGARAKTFAYLIVPNTTIIENLGIGIIGTIIDTAIVNTLVGSGNSITSCLHKTFHGQCLNHWCLIIYFLHILILI